MRTLRLVLVPALVLSALLVGAVSLAHTHDPTAPGLYNSQCPLNDAAAHTVASPLSPPSAVSLAVAPVAPPPAQEGIAPDTVPGPAAPRAPPLG
jgi:hypothetical protein